MPAGRAWCKSSVFMRVERRTHSEEKPAGTLEVLSGDDQLCKSYNQMPPSAAVGQSGQPCCGSSRNGSGPRNPWGRHGSVRDSLIVPSIAGESELVGRSSRQYATDSIGQPLEEPPRRRGFQAVPR